MTRRVTLSGRDLEDARRLVGLLSGEANSTENELAHLSLARTPSDEERLIAKARAILTARQKRIDLFGKAMFGEPPWEMLLQLYASASGGRQTMSRLAELTGSSKATALRWMDFLANRGLIERHPHPTDLRKIFVELSDRGRAMIEAYLKDTGNFTE